ncbi:hypothetical protein B9G98_03876 [Wickerhamiella sorbophila]|uniref:Uncharacterized protein n=1 Tax=Wickerhamiella sorbophila TaxID=45607 RepID=A0A2T0FMP9_9ASCO|nr:hypothetical protein B9G98_03876 [Wickerhamiella sorbophila]PRT56256.1 hypothetical protein B9G98_03876 [Wickerhamiella sorbophila]
MDKAAQRKARFAKPASTPGLVSRGDAVLSKAEQETLFEQVKASPTPYKVRSLREAVIASGPSEFGSEVLQFSVKYAIDSQEIATLKSSLSYLLTNVHPSYPLENPQYFQSLYLIALSFHDLEDAASHLDGSSTLRAYLQAYATRDIARWVAVIKGEKDKTRQKLMLTQKKLFIDQARKLSVAYKKDGTWIEELLEFQ